MRGSYGVGDEKVVGMLAQVLTDAADKRAKSASSRPRLFQVWG
jgi:hypothetical protein